MGRQHDGALPFFTRVLFVRTRRRSTNGKLLHQLCVGKDLCPRCLVLFSNCVSNQIDYRLHDPLAIDGRCSCNAPAESLERNSISNCAAGLLSDSSVHRWNEHWRPSHSASLRILVSTDPVSYTHLRAHETPEHLVCRLLLE